MSGAEFQVFTVPEPGPEVRHVIDREGVVWSRLVDGTWGCSIGLVDVRNVTGGSEWIDEDRRGPAFFFPLVDHTAERERSRCKECGR